MTKNNSLRLSMWDCIVQMCIYCTWYSGPSCVLNLPKQHGLFQVIQMHLWWSCSSILPCRAFGTLDLLTVFLQPWSLTLLGNHSHYKLWSKFTHRVPTFTIICTFANRLVIGAAVSFFHTVLWAVAGMVFLPLLPTPIWFALKASLWNTEMEVGLLNMQLCER